MGSYKSKSAAYFILGWALALALPPWFVPDSKKEFVTKTGVFLSALALDDPGLAPVCGDKIHSLSAQDLEAYPDLAGALKKLTGLKKPGTRVGFDSRSPKALAEKLDQGRARRICFRLEGETFLLEPQPQGGIFRSGLTQVGTSSPESFPGVTMTSGELERYPYLEIYLDTLAARAGRGKQRQQEISQLRQKLGDRAQAGPPGSPKEAAEAFKDIGLRHELRTRQLEALQEGIAEEPFYQEAPSPTPTQEWQPLLDRLDLSSGRATVKTPGYLVGISLQDNSGYEVTPMSGLSLARKIGGAALFLLGLWVLGKSYGRARGIRINPAWAAGFADGMFVIGMGVLSLGPLDYLLVNWFKLQPLLEEALLFTFAVMYLPCLFFLAWMAANMGGQSLEAGPKGVTWHGPGRSRFMAWESIIGLDLRSSHVMVGRMGFLMPRKLQTKLVFKLAQGDEQGLFEPGTRARKEAVLQVLAQHGPQRLERDLRRIYGEWL